MPNDPNPRVLWGRHHTRWKKQLHLHDSIVIEGLGRYAMKVGLNDVVIPLSLARHIHWRLTDLLSQAPPPHEL